MCTGLEPLLAGMGASAGVASLGATALGALGVGALAKQVMPKAPQAPAVAPPEKPPQPTANPVRNAVAAVGNTQMGGPAVGNAGTFLSGPAGVDPKTLTLGRNTLLGQ